MTGEKNVHKLNVIREVTDPQMAAMKFIAESKDKTVRIQRGISAGWDRSSLWSGRV
jgi:hypothetical protein